MIQLIKYSLLAATSALILLTPAGCGKKGQTDTADTIVFQMTPSSAGVERFLKMLGEFHSGYDSDICFQVTPQEISDQYGFEIFKFDTSCASFLLYEEDVYPLGTWFGGYGVTSFAISDMNEDGDPELYFTYSWGSGIHRSQVGYFDTAAKELVSFEFADIGNDSLLKFDENNRLCVYRADCKVNSFVDIELSTTVKTAEILWDSEKISLAEEAKKRMTDSNARTAKSSIPHGFARIVKTCTAIFDTIWMEGMTWRKI